MISIERLYNQGTALGGIGITDDIAFPAEFAVAAIALYDDEGIGFTMSRDQAWELANGLINCLIDA